MRVVSSATVIHVTCLMLTGLRPASIGPAGKCDLPPLGHCHAKPTTPCKQSRQSKLFQEQRLVVKVIGASRWARTTCPCRVGQSPQQRKTHLPKKMPHCLPDFPRFLRYVNIGRFFSSSVQCKCMIPSFLYHLAFEANSRCMHMATHDMCVFMPVGLASMLCGVSSFDHSLDSYGPSSSLGSADHVAVRSSFAKCHRRHTHEAALQALVT